MTSLPHPGRPLALGRNDSRPRHLAETRTRESAWIWTVGRDRYRLRRQVATWCAASTPSTAEPHFHRNTWPSE